MNIQEFYQRNRCENIAVYENLLFQESRYTVLGRATKMFATLLGTDMAKDTVLHQVYEYLKTGYAGLSLDFPWQSEAYAKDDIRKYRRLPVRFSNLQVVKTNVATSFEVSRDMGDGSSTLDGLVHLVLQDQKEQYHAMIIHGGTCSRSMKGKSVQTAAAMDLNCMIAKCTLESSYPGIIIHSVYLTHKNDKPGKTLKDMEISQTASSNMHSLEYKGYYDDNGTFDETAMAKSIVEAMEQGVNSCFGCYYQSLCKTPELPMLQHEKKEAGNAGYQMPNYTQEQLKAVRHKDGPMLICAGPGSGKTATIIGRIRYLVEECNVTPQFILVVTFTTKAEQELKERCLSFLDEANLPYIATLNAFAYRILRENQDCLGKELKLLTNLEQLKIIQNIVNVTEPLSGFHYDQKYGKNGLYKTLARKVEQYLSMKDFEFFSKNPDIGNDFVGFAEMYRDIISCNDYISFDEQISMTNTLFETHPDVLSVYQHLYRYVMVDEYQDVNSDQVKMLYSIASHGNIVVVGDDDQNIFGFRGASSEFMLSFPDKYPESETIILKDNFRSTQTLVSAAQSLIHNNQKRIPKDIHSGCCEKGVEPVLIKSLEPKEIDALITKLIEKGYHYDDIAILSPKNAPLEELHSTLQAPTVLAKSYLRHDGLFTFARAILNLYYSELNDDTAFLVFVSLFGKRHLLRRKKGLSLYESLIEQYSYADFRQGNVSFPHDGIFSDELAKLQDLFALLKNEPSMQSFLEMCVFSIGWDASDAKDVLLEQADKQGVHDIKALATFMDYIVNFEDEKRVEVDTAGRVTLITCHDAKGKEYPVVIIRNDYQNKDEETRRLFYVAVTRAKEQLYIFQDASCKADFLNEFPHTERGCA